MTIDLKSALGPANDPGTVGTMARGIIGSEILKIAADIRGLEAKGQKICNLTVGDFKPSEFPIPTRLGDEINAALKEGHTNYPPADGVLDLRKSVQKFYARSFGLEYPVEGIVIAGGARPIIYGIYRAVVDPGETVVYPVPSWNNNHYAYMMGAKAIEVVTRPEDGFMPTPEQLAPHLGEARLLALCSPLNPTGTMMKPETLKAIAQLVVNENKERAKTGKRPLIVMFDQIYWVLSAGVVEHVTPIQLVPEIAPYTVFVDGISKAFAATGVRVGWGVGPPSIITRMRDVLGHVGAWAPKAEQVATARFLDDATAMDGYLPGMKQQVAARLQALYEGFQGMAARGLPVRAIDPQGAIYLSVQFDLVGKAGLQSTDDVRRMILDKAAFAVVPFRAFGFKEESGWCRLSVGATSVAEIKEALPRVEEAIRSALK